MTQFESQHQTAGEAESKLCESWSIGPLRPWLHELAQRELPVALRGRVDASDIVQQAMLDAWRGSTGFRGTSQAERLAWLRMIVRRAVLQQIRRSYGTLKRDQRCEHLQTDLDLTDSRIAQLASGSTASPAEQVAANEDALQLAAAIKQLTPQQQLLIRLRHFEQLSHDQIAQRLNASPAAMRMQWIRTLKKLHELLAPHLA
ncbi:MAG: sigma-70 family RNA polymerase sigma factor [Pirellulaceae bacterium]|nr:sigma-70 family RNA polymerase sigma factor [Pirellulaceae bacterium]